MEHINIMFVTSALDFINLFCNITLLCYTFHLTLILYQNCGGWGLLVLKYGPIIIKDTYWLGIAKHKNGFRSLLDLSYKLL